MDQIIQDVSELLDLLQAEDVSVRLSAVETLSTINSDEAIAGLVISLEDTSANIREIASEALSQVRGETTSALLSEFLGAENITTRNLAAEILVRIGAETVPALVGWLGHEDHDVRKFVADVLGLIGDSRAVDGLCLALWDENLNVCCSAAEALGLIGEPSATSALIAVGEKIADVRPQAIEALGRIKDSAAIPFLVSNLKTGDPLLAFTASEALGEIGSPQALKEITKLINGESLAVASEAFKSALRITENIRVDLKNHISGERLREFVLEGLLEGDDDVSKFAVRNPELWRDEGLVHELLKSVGKISGDTWTDIVGQCRNIHLNLDDKLITQIKQCKDADKIALLDALLNCMRSETLDALLPFVSDSNPEVRIRVASILGRVDSPKSLIALKKLISDPDGHVRSAAYRGVGWLGDDGVAELIIRGLSDEYRDVREVCVGALVTIGGQEIVDHFTADLQAKDSERQRLAANALGWIGEENVLEPLNGALSHNDPLVRKAALEALSRMGDVPKVEDLMTLINDEDEAVQRVAITSLAKHHQQSAVALLTPFLNGDNLCMQFHVITSLAIINSPETKAQLQLKASSGDNAIRVAAIHALGDMQDASLLAFLQTFLSDPDENVVGACQSAIKSLEEGLPS